MSHQLTFADGGFYDKRCQTRKKMFLSLSAMSESAETDFRKNTKSSLNDTIEHYRL